MDFSSNFDANDFSSNFDIKENIIPFVPGQNYEEKLKSVYDAILTSQDRWVFIAKINSQNGKKLNNKVGEIIGYSLQPEVRMHVKIPQLKNDVIYKIKPTNLMQPPKMLERHQYHQCKLPLKDLLVKFKKFLEQTNQSAPYKQQLQKHFQALQKGKVKQKIPCIYRNQKQSLHVWATGCEGSTQFNFQDVFHGKADDKRAFKRFSNYANYGLCVKCTLYKEEFYQLI